jgi:hypothetical protein
MKLKLKKNFRHLKNCKIEKEKKVEQIQIVSLIFKFIWGIRTQWNKIFNFINFSILFISVLLLKLIKNIFKNEKKLST